ncbi:TlpA family protein disulfide reductase [Acrocarpospora catenulata]|uniref:TlpA family protein disulfide reductase n=1 Tax=Acrocarpospora catenulata TaxID=2836182 RepID=UPI001BDB3691|nr:thioredoxin family protein [Acrocarpospora catenulata]
MAGLIVLGVTLALATVLGLILRGRAGRLRAQKGKGRAGMDVGEPLGERATLVQFSTAFCQPCRATRRVLGEVAAMVPGVRHIEIDAESRLDLVRAYGVLRTPTVFVLDKSGNIVKRASGQPRKADVIAALGHAVDSPSHQPDGA